MFTEKLLNVPTKRNPNMKNVLTGIMGDDIDTEELQSKCNSSMTVKKQNLKSTKISRGKKNTLLLISINYFNC